MAGKSNKRRNRRVNSSESVEVPANPTGNDDNLEQAPVTNEDSSGARSEAKTEPENDNSATQANQEDRKGTRKRKSSKSGGQAKEHKDQLERLKEKDPAFYEYLRERDQELLHFNDEDIDEDIGTDVEVEQMEVDDEIQDDGDEVSGRETAKKEEKPFARVITTEMVDSWCNAIREEGKLAAVRPLMRAFRTACHYGDDGGDYSSTKFSIVSSSVFNKIMLFVLTEMDGILRRLTKLPASGGKKEMITDLRSTKQWKTYNHLVKSYLGNALHVLNQMTDSGMISFTLRRLKFSSIFLAAFPSLLRKYVKVALHFWGTGGGALPVVSLLFLRDLCIRLGADCLDECFKGIYKAYVLNCQFINALKLQHIQFLQNCVIELFGVEIPTAYQHAFVFIRQLAMILREALNTKTKEAFRKVYEWKFMNSLELWTGAICAYSTEADFRLLAFPLTQIISGVARLVPTARYFPLRLRCARMLNRIAAATGNFIPVSMLLLDMLEMKELNRPPTGGVGKSVDLRTILKVSKPALKTRAFQEACVYSVIDELAEHLAQWSYSVAFFELSFIPAVRLRNFCKTTKVDRFRKAMRQLVRQVEATSAFTNEKRKSITFTPNDSAVTSFLQDEKAAGASPLTQYVLSLRERAKQRTDALTESSVLVGEKSFVFGNKMRGSGDEEEDYTLDNEGNAAFSSSWLPGSDSKAKQPKESNKKRKKKRETEQFEEDFAKDEDVVEDLVLSSDEEDGSMSDAVPSDEEDDENGKPPKQQNKKKLSISALKNKKTRPKKSRKGKRASSN
ncbi:nucleolar complex protein 2 homolog [Morus notabilis]|uniref:nucleolar complex protein 2 homolog n=1 Tax=Morus notabilis TaxID=981085 RepID=UPI000CED0660|nr:nucleolar complex protein 2 homolog [Morus notabilis]XP_024029611.1 nucleolar complex protein 2 homolog [Morus notabilis]XP_024029612.1 nucleolar complex protein 2 homolog [Morus notabilis]